MERKIVTDEEIIKKCNETGIKLISIKRDKTRRGSIEYICEKHKDKGTQNRKLSVFMAVQQPCFYCNNSRPKETFKDEMDKTNPNIEILSDYVNRQTTIKCRCKIHPEYVWDDLPSDLLSGCGCGKCELCNHPKVHHSTTKKKSTEAFIREMKDANPNIEIIGEYKGYHNFVKCKCKLDGCEWESYACNLLNQSAGCPECSRKKQQKVQALTNEEFIKRLKNVNDHVEPLEPYINFDTKIWFRCTIHDCNFQSSPRSFLDKKKRGCPKCIQSAGESKMISLLERKGFHVLPQKRFGIKDTCDYSFDAYDVDNNIAYEYQGEQHYIPVNFAGKGEEWAKNELRIVQERDKIKSDYCRNNNIPLIEVPYWEFNNMEEFLDKEISKYIPCNS